MLTSKDIRDVTFSNAMGGYKKDEVDILLDKIEVDYEKYEKIVSAQEAKIAELEEQIESLKNAQNSIQNVLLSAQKLADQIVEDAKAKSQQIVNDAQQNITVMTEKSRKIAEEFDSRASEKKDKLETELSGIIKNAENKKMLIEAATEESVKKQQDVFNAIKLEISAFKNDIMKRYKDHLERISALPDCVDIDPKSAAKIIGENIDDFSAEDINNDIEQDDNDSNVINSSYEAEENTIDEDKEDIDFSSTLTPIEKEPENEE